MNKDTIASPLLLLPPRFTALASLSRGWGKAICIFQFPIGRYLLSASNKFTGKREICARLVWPLASNRKRTSKLSMWTLCNLCSDLFKRRQVMHIRGDKAINLKEVYEARKKGERKREREKRGWKKGLWVDAEVQRITRYIFFFKNDIVEYLINRFEITRETLLEIKILLGVQIIKKKNTQISIYIMFHAVRFFFFSFLSSPFFPSISVKIKKSNVGFQWNIHETCFTPREQFFWRTAEQDSLSLPLSSLSPFLSPFFYSHSGLPPFGYRPSSLSSRTKKFPPSSNGINIHASAIISLAGDFSSIYSDARFKIWLNRRGTIRSDKALQITQWRFVFLMGRKESRKVTLFIKDSLSLYLFLSLSLSILLWTLSTVVLLILISRNPLYTNAHIYIVFKFEWELEWL